MDWTFFEQLLSFDSTSGTERSVAEWLETCIPALSPENRRPQVQRFEVGDGTLNLLFSWGVPQVVFCTHMDTVPPYLPPVFEEDRICGRGSCDAKGQLFAMLSACLRLAGEGRDGFALLLLSGEETGSFGAKAFARTAFTAPFLIIGEPTDGKMVSASKGTKSFDLRFAGEAFHSGYPELGRSAVEAFLQFANELKAKDFGIDPELGETTWNIGLVKSDNPQNILSAELTCRLYFRTTFVSDAAVSAWMEEASSRMGELPHGGAVLTVSPRGGDTPAKYLTLKGFPSAPAAFGSDAPHLRNFREKAIFGPGTIRVAHRSDEHILRKDLEEAVIRYIEIYKQLI